MVMENGLFPYNTFLKVMSYASKSETGGIYMGDKWACPICFDTIELGHPQLPTVTRFRINNSTAKGILTASMHQKYPIFLTCASIVCSNGSNKNNSI